MRRWTGLRFSFVAALFSISLRWIMDVAFEYVDIGSLEMCISYPRAVVYNLSNALFTAFKPFVVYHVCGVAVV